MLTLTFADTHNMVAFLEKSIESDGFHEILDFLNANQIRYALTIQALIDKKKVIITEISIRSNLHLEDAGGTDCLPTATIFKELARMGRVESSEDKDSLGDHEDAPKQGRRIKDIDKDADVSLVDDTQGRSNNKEMFDINDLHGDEINVDMPVGEKQEQS
ncbi:hypothetical protein Tco_0186931, partial [Tanacetum coccineum]